MMSPLLRWLAAPVLPGDEENSRRLQFLNAISLFTVAFILLVATTGWLVGRTPNNVFVTDAAIIATAFFWRYLAFRGNITTAGIGILATGILLITAVVAQLGTIRVPSAATYLIVVITSGMLFEMRGIVVTTVASSLAIGSLIAAQNAGMLPEPNYAVTYTQWVTYTILFGTTGALTYLALKSTVAALERSRKEVEERKRAERQLRKLLRAVEQSPSSIVITDLSGTIEYVNPRFTQVTGYTFEEAVGQNPRILKTEETPRETHRELWDALSANREWRGKFVNRKKDGTIYYESATISTITDENGVPTNYLAVKEDITEQKHAEDALRESEARFRSLFEQTHDAVVILDLKGNHVMTNQRAVELLGYASAEIGEISVHHTSDELERSQDVMQRLLAGETIPLYERRFKKKNGEIFTAEVNVELVRDKFGDPLHIQSVMRDITHRKRVEEALKKANDELSLRLIEVEHLHGELRQQALHDPLTGLHNRRYLTETLPREIARVDREKDSLSVIVADLDHFKEINDANGHHAGDEFLVEIARILKGSTRGADLVCRYGGEEFVLVLPGTPIHAAERRAEEIRRRCERTIIRHDGRDLTTTMSLGVATYPEHTISADELISLADKAMYESKRGGRNRVTVWSDGRVLA